MSNVAVLRSERAEARNYLGPAEVVSVSADAVEVRIPRSGAARARLALAFTYEPQPGDEVLVIGNEEGHYVIGVLRGTGRTALAFSGDVDLRAVDGVLRISGDKGVHVEGPELHMRASKLEILAGAVVEKFTSLRQRVTELLSVQAGQSHSVVEGASFSRSKSATMLTEEKVTINGKAVYLG